MRSVSTVFIILLLSSFIHGQGIWDQGAFEVTYGSPFPNQSWELEGPVLDDTVPGQGVGGFQMPQNGTNYLVLMAYETVVEEADTTADAFIVFMTDTTEFVEGEYALDPDLDALRLMFWLEDIDPEQLMALLDTSFSLDSLYNFNPYLALSGDISIDAIGPQSLDLTFSAMLMNTELDVRIVPSGSFSLESTLPTPVYGLGILDLNIDGMEHQVSGSLNPLVDANGVGLMSYQNGDTLSYLFLSYALDDQGTYDLNAVQITGTASDFPGEDFQLSVPISIDSGTLPIATPIMMENLSQDSLLGYLENLDLNDLLTLNGVYLPVAPGTSEFVMDAEGHASLIFSEQIMGSLGALTMTVGETWYVANQWPSQITAFENLPTTDLVAGPAYPNPFNSSTVIPVQLSSSQNLELIVYDILGGEKLRIDLGYMTQGVHQLPLELGQVNLPSGPYHFMITGPGSEATSGSFLYLK